MAHSQSGSCPFRAKPLKWLKTVNSRMNLGRQAAEAAGQLSGGPERSLGRHQGQLMPFFSAQNQIRGAWGPEEVLCLQAPTSHHHHHRRRQRDYNQTVGGPHAPNRSHSPCLASTTGRNEFVLAYLPSNPGSR